ncbi:hypothetical protein TSUD_40640 [Trifolium subterraneum]|nr:hypothetical protein TSUD_40640 [Trifolium subterraneum]
MGRQECCNSVQFLLHTRGDCFLKSSGRLEPQSGGAHLPSARILLYPNEKCRGNHSCAPQLQLYELIESKVEGDGNCQFRALSDQLYRSPNLHKFVREQIVQQLKSDPDLYAGYVPMAYSEYLKKMSKSGEWGDHVTLQAAADWYGVKIFVITSFKDTCYIEILPQTQKSGRVIFLSFWAEVHYNSIYPEGEAALAFKCLHLMKRKKRDGGILAVRIDAQMDATISRIRCRQSDHIFGTETIGKSVSQAM